MKSSDEMTNDAEALAVQCAELLARHCVPVQATALLDLHSTLLSYLPIGERVRMLQRHANMALAMADLLEKGRAEGKRNAH